MFYGCYNINQPVKIGNYVEKCYSMFTACWRFNQPVNIPDAVTNCEYMFNSCNNLNQPIKIGNNVINCYCMFTNCYNFNQQIVIPSSVNHMYYAFANCYNMNQNIYIKRSTTPFNCVKMFNSWNNQHRINIFCPTLSLLKATTATTSIVGRAITWTDMENGCYNATENIYLYNNLPEGI